MNRWIMSIVCAFAMIAGVRAGDQDKKPPVEQKGEAEPKNEKKPPVEQKGEQELKKEKKPAPAAPEGESDEAKILERLTKNTKTAEEKLGEADTSDETRTLQREILKDIDELLKKKQSPPQDSQNPPPDSSPSGSSADQKPMDGSSSQQKPSGGSSSQQKPSGGSSSQQKSGMSRREQREQKRKQQEKNAGASAKNTPKPMGGAQPMPMGGNQPMPMANAGKDPQNPMGGQPNRKPPTDLDPKLAEMYKDVWGHLPEKMRQEMDTYFKDRFMPRYNDLLKQYYSTIAEQNKKK